MWHPYRSNFTIPPEVSQNTPQLPDGSLPPPHPSVTISPPSTNWHLPFYTQPTPPLTHLYPRPPQIPTQPQIPLVRPPHINHVMQQDAFHFDLDNAPAIKEERRDGPASEYSLPEPSCLPPFLPAPRSPAPYLPPFSAVPCATSPSLPPPTLPTFLPQPHSDCTHNPLVGRHSSFEPPCQQLRPIVPEPEPSNPRKRQREAASSHLPPLLSPFPSHSHTSYISSHPPPPSQQERHQTISPPSADDDNPNNKRQRVSVVTTTSVRTNANRAPGYPPGVDVSSTTTTTTISTSTTTTTSRSVSTTTTTTTRGNPAMAAPFVPPFGSLLGSNPASFMNSITNRLRQDPRHFPMMHHPQEATEHGWRDRGTEEDVRVAFDELRDFLARSSSMLSPFIHFRLRTGRGGQDDDEEDDDDEEEEEAVSFEQMNFPELEFKEGETELNEKLCVICQDEYKQGEKLSTLPCVHHFHTDCIKKWVDECKPECPLCKAELI